MTESSWDKTVANSEYHFSHNHIIDREQDVLEKVGTFYPLWDKLLPEIIDGTRPATWATRGYKGEGNPIPTDDLREEEYDIQRVGADPDAIISHLSWDLPPILQDISNLFGLENMMARIHVQMPGEVWHRHIDKLQKWSPNNPDRVKRFFIHLTDWQPGHFWELGNYHYSHWMAGDVFTFDWVNLPHCTANAGHSPRVTLQLTGIQTTETQKFCDRLKKYM